MPHIPPGLLRRDDNPDVLLMAGTAGHVDHGKTRLVGLLTGCDTDRLKAEKERGMSIELGFAPCSIGRGLAVGIVDVPGHEQFIRNMVAGAVGMDLAMLLVAADDGVMPQTIEHLQIMQFLGVQHGMVVVSKIDLATPERVAAVKEEAAALVRGTFLEGAPICAVSSETLEGFGTFYNTLAELASKAAVGRRRGVFRMPIERVFSAQGHGTVVTGIPTAGNMTIGDEVIIQPGGRRARVRGIQCFLRAAESGGAGQCLAMNLPGLPRDKIRRGGVVTRPGYAHPSRYIQIELTACGDISAPLKNNESIRLHTGAVEAPGRLLLYEDGALPPGRTALGAVRLDEEVSAFPGDRFVIRRNSPPATVAGGRVLCPRTQKPRGPRVELLKELEARRSAFGSDEERFEYEFALAGPRGTTAGEAAVETGLELADARRMTEALLASGTLVPCSGDRCLHVSGQASAIAELKGCVENYHNEQPAALGPSMSELKDRTRLPEDVIQSIAALLVERGILQRHESRVALRDRPANLAPAQAALLARIEAVYREGRYAAPRPEELPELTGEAASVVEALLKYLYQQGALVRLDAKVTLHRQWLDEAERLVVRTIQAQGSLDSGDFKALIDSSRKYALAILDYFDGMQMTLRSGNARKLHPAYLRKHAELCETR